MKFRTAQRIVLALDILMLVAVVAVMLHAVPLWVLAAALCLARIWLYLHAPGCPHCGKPVRPDRGVVRCPYCGERMDDEPKA